METLKTHWLRARAITKSVRLRNGLPIRDCTRRKFNSAKVLAYPMDAKTEGL